MTAPRKRSLIISLVLLSTVCFLIYRSMRQSPGDAASAAPTRVTEQDDGVRDVTMAEVLDLARAAREHLSGSLKDYTARFVKQEMDLKGVVGPATEMTMKVQTRLRSDSDDAPMRVYLRFNAPESVNGREVLWCEDLNDGKMAVHEVGLLFSLKTLWLDPTGLIAMQGQRYPITQIGLVRLVEQLIERGEKDRENPDISVILMENHLYDELETQLIRVTRAKPSGEEDDFSLAEIVIDPERQLVLSFRSFGWPASEGDEAPIIESYEYHDVKTNIGLTDSDFETTNPAYSFPAL